MTECGGTVWIVDDDASIRDALRMLFESAGHTVRLFPTARAFLEAHSEVASAPGCLVLDIRMPGMTGLELQRHLNEARIPVPVIFLTAHADVPTAVDAVRAGAIDFLQKPFRADDLLARVEEALLADRRDRIEAEHRAAAAGRIGTLTPREREVFDRVVAGESNKAVARSLGVSRRTVEVHRANVMRKVGAHSVSELVLAAVAAGAARLDADEPAAGGVSPFAARGDVSDRSARHTPSR